MIVLRSIKLRYQLLCKLYKPDTLSLNHLRRHLFRKISPAMEFPGDLCLIIVGPGEEAEEVLIRRRLAAGGRVLHILTQGIGALARALKRACIAEKTYLSTRAPY